MTIKYPLQPLKEMIKKVVKDNDVQFFWLITTADFEIDDDEIHIVLFFLNNRTLCYRTRIFNGKWVARTVQTAYKKIHTTHAQKASKENYMMQHNNANLYIKFSCLLSDNNIISSIQCTCTLKTILYTIAQIQSVFYKKKCPLG